MKKKMSEKGIKYYGKGVGKLLHIMRFSRPEIVNETRELSKFMTEGTSQAHLQAMLEEIKYVADTPERGWFMKANAYWDGDLDFEFTIEGHVDCGHATDPDSRKSVSGYSVFCMECQ